MNGQSNAIIAEDVACILETPLSWQDLKGSTVIVSGASGCLPAYIVETLAEMNRRCAGIRIIGLVRNTEKARRRLGHLQELGVELFPQDVSLPLSDELPAAEYIIHAASQASPRHYGSDPVGTLEANTIGTQQLLRHAHRSRSRSFLFFSSGEVYGVPADSARLLSETDFGYLDPATVRSCYAESKRLGETMCVSWHHQFGVPARIVRPFHTYGPGMDLMDGRVFADFVADVIARRDIVLKSDGLSVRPFCYLADATAGFFTVLLKGEPGQAYNVANPNAECSIVDLAHTLAGLFPERGVGVRFEAAPEGNAYLKSPIVRSCPSVEKIARLGWIPRVSVADGFRRTIISYS